VVLIEVRQQVYVYVASSWKDITMKRMASAVEFQKCRPDAGEDTAFHR